MTDAPPWSIIAWGAFRKINMVGRVRSFLAAMLSLMFDIPLFALTYFIVLAYEAHFDHPQQRISSKASISPPTVACGSVVLGYNHNTGAEGSFDPGAIPDH
jgi:hypothetical protein